MATKSGIIIPYRCISKKQLIKIYLINAFCTIIFSTLLAWNHAECDYESSIYSSIPLLFWISMYLLIISSIVILICHLYKNGMNFDTYASLCILVVYLAYILVSSLFLIHGYYMWNISGDVGTHLGWIKTIMNTGHLPKSLFYPAMHIFTFTLMDITNLDIVLSHKMVPILFIILFVPFMYLLAKSIFPSKNIIPNFVFLFSCSFMISSISLAPFKISVLFFPFILAIYFMVLKKKTTGLHVLLLICLIYLTISHPVAAISFGLIMFSIYIANFISHKFPDLVGSEFVKEYHIFSNPIVLLVVCFFLWLSQFVFFGETISTIYDALIQTGTDQYSVMTQAIDNAIIVGNNPMIEIFKRYGMHITIIFSSFSGIFLLYKKHRFFKEYNLLYLLSFSFLITILFMILTVIGVGFSIATRWLNYILIIGSIICSYVIFVLISYSIQKKHIYSMVSIFLTIVLLCTTMTIGIISFYPSPYNEQASFHCTEKSVYGMKWFFNNRNTQVSLIGISIAPGRYADLLLSQDEKRQQKLMNYMYSTQKYGIVDLRPPFHFGYNSSNSLLGSFYSQETDMITTQGDIEFYSIVRPEIASIQWNSNDFEMLVHDPTVNKIYWNGEYTIWKIIP